METKKLLVTLCVAVLGAISAHAGESTGGDNIVVIKEGSDTTNAVAIITPEKFVQGNSAKVLKLLRSGASENEKQKKLTSIFFEVTDADWIAKFVMGRYWQTLSESQKREYLRAYRKYLASIYVDKFRSYNDQTVEVRNIKELSSGTYQVVTDIVGSSSNIRIEYRIRKSGDSYKIHDIIAEGVSLIISQRSEFASIMSSDGIESLIQRLDSKAND